MGGFYSDSYLYFPLLFEHRDQFCYNTKMVLLACSALGSMWYANKKLLNKFCVPTPLVFFSGLFQMLQLQKQILYVRHSQ